MADDDATLVLHVRQTFSCLRQLLRYTIVTRAPPWRYCAMVDGLNNEELLYMQAVADFSFKLHVSQEPPPAFETPAPQTCKLFQG